MRKALLSILLLVMILTGCQPATSQDDTQLSSRILLWHSWDETEAVALNQVLEQFSQINPQARIISVAVPADELLQQYKKSAAQGLGPDIFLGSNDWVQELADANLIRAIQAGKLKESDYLPTAVTAVRYQEKLYGFPLSLHPVALYYNTKLVKKPVTTLDELIAHTTEEKRFALIPLFEPAYWGIQTFGSGLFDAGPGNFTLAQSGFTEWLAWLNQAQREPGIILNQDGPALQRLFIEEEIAYYVAGPDELSTLLEAMGEDTIGVVPLPAGPHGPSGPLLSVEAVMLSTASSQSQAQLALALAQYLTNAEQSRTLMRLLRGVPANRRVAVDPRVHPFVDGFAQQSKTAVTLPNSLFRPEFFQLGNRAYTSVLSGVSTPAEAVCEFGLAVNELQGYTAETSDLPADCTAENKGLE